MSRIGILFSPEFLRHYSKQYHPENPERLKTVVKAIRESGLNQAIISLSARKLATIDLLQVHTLSYIERLKRLCSKGGGIVDGDEGSYANEASLEVAMFASGGICAAIDEVVEGQIDHGLMLVRPPGHHAFSDKGSGFCLINHAAIAARYAQKHGFGKILIIDYDCHHGNGTQEIFYSDDTVGFFSIHQFPSEDISTGSRDETGDGKGLGYTVNVPLMPGCGDDEYRSAFEHDLDPFWAKLNPDFVMVSMGFDAHIRDPLGDMRVSTEGFADLARHVIDLARGGTSSKKTVPVFFILEGGYDAQALGDSAVATTRVLLDINL